MKKSKYHALIANANPLRELLAEAITPRDQAPEENRLRLSQNPADLQTNA